MQASIMSKPSLTPRRMLPIGMLLAALAGCASTPYAERLSQRQAAYTAAAGTPVRSFHFVGPLYSWEPLSDQQLVVYTRPSRAWLLDVDGCTNLSFANAIGLTSNLHEVSVRFDRVLTGRGNFPCSISQIRPIDVAHLKAAQQAQRKIDEKPREAAGGGH
jgi:hypothetical protein